MSLKFIGFLCSGLGTIGFIRGYNASTKYKIENNDLQASDKVVFGTLNAIYYSHPMLIPCSILKIINKDEHEYFEVFINTKKKDDLPPSSTSI